MGILDLIAGSPITPDPIIDVIETVQPIVGETVMADYLGGIVESAQEDIAQLPEQISVDVPVNLGPFGVHTIEVTGEPGQGGVEGSVGLFQPPTPENSNTSVPAGLISLVSTSIAYECRMSR